MITQRASGPDHCAVFYRIVTLRMTRRRREVASCPAADHRTSLLDVSHELVIPLACDEALRGTTSAAGTW